MLHHLRLLINRHPTFWLLLSLFAIALLTRLWHIELPINFDENYWLRRAVHFYIALLTGKLEETFLRHHPGVTNIWLIGAALSLRYYLHDIWPLSPPLAASGHDSLLDYLRAIEYIDQMPLEAYTNARILAALLTASTLVAFYWLSRRLLGNAIALLATIILLFEPFFVAYQRSLTTDANQTNFTWLALLAFLLYLQAKKHGSPHWRWLILSAISYALALLSKIPALLSLPALLLWLPWYTLKGHLGQKADYRQLFAEIICWGLIVASVIFLLWPALWVALPQTALQFYQQLSEEVGGHEQFFMGQLSHSPGSAFYPIVLAYRLSPVLLFGLALGSISLLLSHKHDPNRTALAAIALNLILVLILLDSRASKIDRYIMPLIPGIALLAAAGYLRIVYWLSEKKKPKQDSQTDRAKSEAGPEFNRHQAAQANPTNSNSLTWLLALISIIQVSTFTYHLPYHLTYFNPLLGGPAGAKDVLMIGNGELLDQAAEWLNEENASTRVASWYDASFAPYYHGQTLSLSADSAGKWPWVQAQRVVLYINQFQRQGIYYTTHTDYFSLQKPLHTIRAYSVDYAQIYAGPIVEASTLAKEAITRTTLDFEHHATLLGYEVQKNEIGADEAAIITLYWQAQEPFPAPDYYINLSIRHPNGLLLNKKDQLPVYGFFPVSDWQKGQIIRDVHAIDIPVGTPPGAYHLEIGLYSPQQGKALSIRENETARGQQITLTTLQVTRPTSSVAPLADEMQIGNRITAQNAPSLNGAHLLGYEWAPSIQPSVGEGIPITLLWQANSQSDKATEIPHLYLRLKNKSHSWQRAIGHPLGGNYPPQEWKAGDMVRDIWLALLPADAPSGQYQLQLVAQSSNQNTLLLELGELTLKSRPHHFELVTPSIIQQATLAHRVRLLGYDISAPPRQPLNITLYWQALGEQEQNYTRFVQLLNEEGQLIAQQDSQPSDAPMTTWLKNEILTDNTQINLSPDLPPGSYRLIVGYYDPITWERLPNDEGNDHILLKEKVEIP